MIQLEEVFTVHVEIDQALQLNNEDGDSVVMISFGGQVTGKYFKGTVLDGGVDTQVIGKFGDRHTLSARYMLEGTDYTGECCKIYIENNGNVNTAQKDIMFRTDPVIITNSKALSFLNKEVLIGEGHATASGVDIKIFRCAEG